MKYQVKYQPKYAPKYQPKFIPVIPEKDEKINYEKKSAKKA